MHASWKHLLHCSLHRSDSPGTKTNRFKQNKNIFERWQGQSFTCGSSPQCLFASCFSSFWGPLKIELRIVSFSLWEKNLAWKCTYSDHTTQTPILCGSFPCVFQGFLCSWISLGRSRSAQLWHFWGGLQCAVSKRKLLRNTWGTQGRDRGWTHAPTQCGPLGAASLGTSGGSGCKKASCSETPEVSGLQHGSSWWSSWSERRTRRTIPWWFGVNSSETTAPWNLHMKIDNESKSRLFEMDEFVFITGGNPSNCSMVIIHAQSSPCQAFSCLGALTIIGAYLILALPKGRWGGVWAMSRFKFFFFFRAPIISTTEICS